MLMKIFVWEGDDTWSTVVDKVQEHIVIGTGFENSTVASFDLSLVSGDNSQVVGWGNVITTVVDFAAGINVSSSRALFVE